MYYIKEIWALLFSGSKLVTASGDTTVKIWDFSKAECVHTFTDHTHAGKNNLKWIIRYITHIYRYWLYLIWFYSRCVTPLCLSLFLPSLSIWICLSLYFSPDFLQFSFILHLHDCIYAYVFQSGAVLGTLVVILWHPVLWTTPVNCGIWTACGVASQCVAMQTVSTA